MALTRPTIYNLNTNIEVFNDSMTVLNAAALSPSTDVGLLFNRAQGLVPNAAAYWSESTQSFVYALTNSNGAPNTNVAVSSYANVTVGNLLLVQGSILGVIGNITVGNLLANAGLFANTATITGNTTSGNIFASGFFYANGTPFTSSSYGNVQMLANLAAASNITVGGNLTVGGNIVTTTGVFWPNGSPYSSGSGGSGKSTSSATPPSSPGVGDIWYNTATDDMYRWTTDGTTAYWLDITGPTTANTSVLTYTLNGVTNSSIYFGVANVTATATLVDTVPATGNTTVSWKVTSTDNINNRFAVTTIDAITNGTNIFYDEYGFVSSQNGFNVATFTSNISAGNVNLYAVGDSANVTVAFERTVLGIKTATGYIGQTGPQGAQGNVGPAGAVTATTGNIVTTSANAAVSTTTGALQVAGGAGIGGNLYVGANVVVGTGVFWANGNAYSSGSGKSTSSATAPAAPGIGDIWYNTVTDDVYRYTTDGTNSFWLDITGPAFTPTGNANNLSGNTITANQLVMYGNILPGANVTYNIGSPTQRFASLYLSGNTIDLGGAVVKTDATSGAIAFIPVPTAANPNPTGIVVAPSGSITTVTTTGGNLNANSISNASNSVVGTGSVVGNLVASGNAVIQNINLAGGNNLLLRSTDLTNGAWTQTNITVTGSQADPFGGTTASLFNDGTTASIQHYLTQGFNTTAQTYTLSCYAKAGTSNYFGMGCFTSGNFGVIFNLTTGAFSAYIGSAPTSYSSTNVGNGWWRLSITVPFITGTNYFTMYMSEDGTSFTYTGTSKTVYVSAPQLEPGIIASPYTPTTASAVTTYNTINIPYGNLAVSGNINLASTGNNNSLVLQSQSNVDISANNMVLSNGTGVTAITRTAGGANYSSATTPAITAPTTAGGVQATATANMGMNGNPTVTAGGTGYTLNDILTVSGGTYTAQAQLQVTGISGGVITAVTVINNVGSYTVVPTSPFSVTGGTGSAATFTLTNWSVQSLNITNAGSGYVEQPTVTFSGGGGSGATAYATIGSGTTVKGIGNQLNLATSSGTGFAVADAGVNTSYYWQAIGGAFTGILRSSGSTQDGLIQTSGTGGISLQTNNGAQTQFKATHTASAVNYVNATGAATGGSPTISAQGSDSNIHLSLNGKGTGGVRTQFYHTVGYNYNNNLTLSGNVPGGAPSIVVYGTDTNVSMTLVTQGTGNITTANPVVITNANVSVSASTGALQVTGGAGIAGNVNIGGQTAHTGNVGIGTSSPLTGLHISQATNPQLIINNPNSGSGSLMMFGDGGTFKQAIGHINTTNSLQFGYGGSATNNSWNGSIGMSLNSSGNLGIGTTGPSERLHVSGNGIMSSIYPTANPSAYTTVSNMGASGVLNWYNYAGDGYSNAPGTATYFPYIHWSSVQASYGYRHHTAIGTYRSGGADWGSTMIAVGGNDSYPTTAFLFRYTGDFTAPGTVYGATKSFRIPHPHPDKEDTHNLVYASVESPKLDLMFRGEVALVNGAATVNLDTESNQTEGTFVALCRDVQCFTTNETDWTAVKGKVTGNLLNIVAQDPESTATISWMVIGHRQDKLAKALPLTDDDGYIITETEQEHVHKTNYAHILNPAQTTSSPESAQTPPQGNT